MTLWLILIVEILASLLLGHLWVAPERVFDPDLHNLIFNIRLPRILAAAIIGAGLATAGASYQAAFKNPIVAPSVLGVTYGAGIGAAICMLLGMGTYIGVGASIVGCITVLVVWKIGRVFTASTAYILIVGVIVSGVAASILSLIKFLADPDGVLPTITFWLMGSLSSIRWANQYYLLAILAITLVLRWSRYRLDLLYQPSDILQSMGVDELRLTRLVVIGATLITALAAAISGVIGMVGLAIPHLVRIAKGKDDSLSTMKDIQVTGAIFLVGIDTFIRMLSLELPIGILTSLLGASIFGVTLIIRVKRKGELS